MSVTEKVSGPPEGVKSPRMNRHQSCIVSAHQPPRETSVVRCTDWQDLFVLASAGHFTAALVPWYSAPPRNHTLSRWMATGRNTVGPMVSLGIPHQRLNDLPGGMPEARMFCAALSRAL